MDTIINQYLGYAHYMLGSESSRKDYLQIFNIRCQQNNFEEGSAILNRMQPVFNLSIEELEQMIVDYPVFLELEVYNKLF